MPMVTDDIMDMKQLLESEIHYRNEDYMEADNDSVPIDRLTIILEWIPSSTLQK